MNTVLFIGGAFGLLVGIAHASAKFQTQRNRAGRHPNTQHNGNVPTLYYALWTVVLWILFGSYVLYLWIAANVVFFGHMCWQRLQSSRRK